MGYSHVPLFAYIVTDPLARNCTMLHYHQQCMLLLLLLSRFSCVRLFATPWTVAYQAPPSMGFSRQECWNGLPFPSPGDLPNPGMEPGPPALQADALLSKPPGKPQKTEYFPPNVGNNTMTSALLSAHTLSYDTRSPSHCSQTRKSK